MKWLVAIILCLCVLSACEATLTEDVVTYWKGKGYTECWEVIKKHHEGHWSLYTEVDLLGRGYILLQWLYLSNDVSSWEDITIKYDRNYKLQKYKTPDEYNRKLCCLYMEVDEAYPNKKIVGRGVSVYNRYYFTHLHERISGLVNQLENVLSESKLKEIIQRYTIDSGISNLMYISLGREVKLVDIESPSFAYGCIYVPACFNTVDVGAGIPIGTNNVAYKLVAALELRKNLREMFSPT